MEPQQASDNEPMVDTPAPAASAADAPVTTVEVDDGAAGFDLAELRARFVAGFRREVVDRPGGFALDLASLGAVAWLLWWLADNDGGLRNRELWQPAAYVMVLTPFLLAEWRRAPRPVRILLALLPLGAILSFAFAVDRSRFVGDALTFGMVPGLLLASTRLARRWWTSVAVLAIVLVGFFSWSWLAGLKWWGWTDLGSQPRWELLSWRNQGGILTAAFGVWISGIALAGKRSPSLVAAGVAGLGLAGAWLSSSRAAIVFGAFGLLVVAWLTVATSAEDRPRIARSTVGRLAGIVLASVAIVAALQTMLPPTATSPLASRGASQSLSNNAAARTSHWKAAAGMFAERPLTGEGIGSYRAIMVRHNPAEGNLTASAHSAWFEGLAEGGLVFGLPLAGLGLLAAVGVLRLPRRMPDLEDDEEFGLRRATVLGAAGAGAAVIAHASIDFDFHYATLVGTAVVAMGFVLQRFGAPPEESEPDGPPSSPGVAGRRLVAALALAPAVGLLALGTWGAILEQRGSGSIADLEPEELATVTPPWNTDGRLAATRILVEDGELDAALAAARGAASWNPGDPDAQMNLARLQYLRGELTGQELLDRLELPPTSLSQWTLTAQALLDGGDLRAAEIAARQAIDFHPTYEAWGITNTVGRAWQVLIDIGTRAKGCQEGQALLDQAIAQGFDDEGLVVASVTEWFETELCPA